MVTPPSKHVSPVLLQLLLLQLLLLLLMWLPLSTTGAAAGPSLSAAAGASAVLRFQSLPNGPAPPPDTPTAAAPPIQQVDDGGDATAAAAAAAAAAEGALEQLAPPELLTDVLHGLGQLLTQDLGHVLSAPLRLVSKESQGKNRDSYGHFAMIAKAPYLVCPLGQHRDRNGHCRTLFRGVRDLNSSGPVVAKGTR